MKRASYSTAVKAIAMSVALVFSSMTFAAETKCTKVALADKKAKVTKVAPTTVTKKAPSFLFVIQAKQGKIETKNGKTYLVLQHTDVNHVIMFSDRPNRIIKVITGNDLQKLWKVGNNSFEKDPPNAVLSSAGQKAQIVILNGITVTDTTVVFPISISADVANLSAKLAMQRFSDIVLTLDDIPGWEGLQRLFRDECLSESCRRIVGCRPEGGGDAIGCNDAVQACKRACNSYRSLD